MLFRLNPDCFFRLNLRVFILILSIASIGIPDTLKAGRGINPIDIHGTVLNENGDPLQGVSVTIKGTSGGTQTDAKGLFSLKQVHDNAVLVLSAVSYETKEIQIDGKNSLLIHLKLKAGNLGIVDVVSTGYQSLPKERVTGSFTQVDNATLNQQVGTTILSRLDGVAGGVFFPKQTLQNGPALMIRGLSTINGPKDPLIVVDNFPYDGDISNVNPSDVESITVLKDAAAASIWGARAGNGVIVITMKKGRFNQPMKISFNSNVIITAKPDLRSLRMIPASDYIDLEKQLFANGYYDQALSDLYNYPAVSPAVELLAAERAGTISSADATAQINAYRSFDARSQWEKQIYQKGVNQQYALNLNGGSEKMNYYFSAGYDRGADPLAAVTRRISLVSQNTFHPVKGLQISAGAIYTQNNSQSGKPGFNTLSTGAWKLPYIAFKDASGNPAQVALTLRQSYTDTAGGGRLLDWKYYPLSDWQHNMANTNRQDLLANISINYEILKGLSAGIKYLYERQTSTFTQNEDVESFAARDLINRFTQIDPSGNVTNIAPAGGIINLSNNLLESQNIRGQIDFSRTWRKNDLTLLAGAELRQAHSTNNGAFYYGYDPNTGTSVNPDYYNYYPTYINGSYLNIPGSSGLGDQLNRYIAFYANGAYTYSRKYILSASARRDASNLFGVATNNKWNPLWSAGAAWILSRESFYHYTLFPLVKIRFTYGFSGNTDPSRTGVTTLSSFPPDYITHLPFSRIDQFPNPELRWEKIKTVNLGIDFGTRGNRVTGSFEAYFKKGIDLFGPATFDPTAALNTQSFITKNVANMQGKGVELNLNSRNIQGRLSWNTSLIFNYTLNKTTNYFVDSGQRSGGFVNPGTQINPMVGKPLYSIVALRWGGLDQNGNPQGYVDGKLSEDYYTIYTQTRKEDLVYRSALPVVYGSLSNTVRWDRLSLIINVSYSFGYYFVKPSFNYSTLFSNGANIGSSDYINRWRKPGDENRTNVPAMIYPADVIRDEVYSSSDALIDRGDNIRLRFINLAYDLNPSGKSIGGIHLQFYVNASNLKILWRANQDGIDPDAVNGLALGRSLAFGLRANF